MKCPICHFKDTRVVDSRPCSDDLCIRRRRECQKCNFRFSTYEEVEILDLTVTKRNGKKESYNRNKLIRGLRRSLEKRSITEDDFKKLVHAIERDIQKLRKNEVKSEKIGKIVMKHLKKIDHVAYIRFASVYEDFKDLHDFKEELNKFKNIKKKKK